MSRTVLTFCILGVVSCLLCSCSKSKSIQRVGEHNVVIIETHVLGGSSRSTVQGVQGEPQLFTYESQDLRIRLEGEVLTVNGRKYLIPKKDDSITVRHGRVEINGQRAKPEDR